MSRKIQPGERDTYNRLWALVREGVIHTFNVPKPNKWEIFVTADDLKAAGGVKRKEADRVYLTKAEVRARFQMDAKPEPSHA